MYSPSVLADCPPSDVELNIDGVGAFSGVTMPGALFCVCLKCSCSAWRMASGLVGVVDVWRVGAILW